MKRFLFILLLAGMLLESSAQHARLNKMSALVRRAVIDYRMSSLSTRSAADKRLLTAFVRIEGQAEEMMRKHDCKELARWDDLYIMSIPLRSLGAFSCEPAVRYIEAGESCSTLLDVSAAKVSADKAWTGESLPQAFTGKGVVVGVEDVGFDVTHPTFYTKDASTYRIKRFWDQLSTDSQGSSLYVGADYQDEASILRYAHSRDASIISHGTHTAGIAAGSGYDSSYRGIAWESDICLVSNTVGEDNIYISEEDKYKYTSATDVLGYQYIFNYAASVGKPCVISFSEGSHQSFWQGDQLVHEALEKLTGPGRIFVASAGNDGYLKTYLDKPSGIESRGVFLTHSDSVVFVNLRADAPFTIRITAYEKGEKFVRDIPSADVLALPDSMLNDRCVLGTHDYGFLVCGYPTFYDDQKMAFELYLTTNGNFGTTVPVSVELVGADAHVELFKCVGTLTENTQNLSLKHADNTHSILTPGCARSAVCVGGTAYRTSFLNYYGAQRGSDERNHGTDLYFASSVGPTFDETVKPDVVAPASNVISSYSSYYIEDNLGSWNVNNDVAHFAFKGRTYGWNASSGTSMSAPVVAGAVALWLQACPTLTPDEVKAVMARTCRHPDNTMDYPNNVYGNGEIDIYKGLLDILHVTGIPGISDHQPQTARFRLSADGELSVLFAEDPPAACSLVLYSPSGVCLQRTSGSTLQLAQHPRGLYVVQLQSADKRVEGSTLIRW